VGCFVCLVGRDDESIASETRARTDNLAQVSRIRLGESDEGSSKPHCAKGRPSDLLELLKDERDKLNSFFLLL